MHQANVTVVNAAEVALNQVMNLVTALVMKNVLGMGRDEAVQGLPVKVVSCLCVTVGIILSSMSPRKPVVSSVVPPKPRKQRPIAASRLAARMTTTLAPA